VGRQARVVEQQGDRGDAVSHGALRAGR
jgi:hypothetical protein